MSEAASIGIPAGSTSSGRPRSICWPLVRCACVDVDAPVGHDALRDLHRPGALGPPCQQLAADGVAHVVGQQGQAVHAELGHVGGREVGLQRHGVRPVGFGGQPVAEKVEQEDAPPRPEPVEHGGVVERRRGEAVQNQQGRVLLGPDGRRVNGEDALAGERPVACRCPPTRCWW